MGRTVVFHGTRVPAQTLVDYLEAGESIDDFLEGFPSREVMSRLLIIIGLAFAAVGLLWPWIGRLGLGRLPGDIWIHGGSFTFYAPITTSILVSLVLSLILWLLSR